MDEKYSKCRKMKNILSLENNKFWIRMENMEFLLSMEIKGKCQRSCKHTNLDKVFRGQGYKWLRSSVRIVKLTKDLMNSNAHRHMYSL